jgi:hypothetical protein
MKNVFSCFVLALILVNCQDSKENLTGNKFSKNVGQKIPNDVAARWAERFRNSNEGSRTTDFSLDINTLQSLIEPMDDKLGISFHHALDDESQHHLLASFVTEDHPELTVNVIDVNDGPIDISVAQEWTDRYKTENPAGVWSHFFGIYVFEQIAGLIDVAQVDLIQGIDDGGQSQILIYVWTSKYLNGRSQAEELNVFDKSSPCPPYCSSSDNNSE